MPGFCQVSAGFRQVSPAFGRFGAGFRQPRASARLARSRQVCVKFSQVSAKSPPFPAQDPSQLVTIFIFQNGFQLNCQLSTACLRGGGCLSSFAVKSRSTQPTCPVQCAVLDAGDLQPSAWQARKAIMKTRYAPGVGQWAIEVMPGACQLYAGARFCFSRQHFYFTFFLTWPACCRLVCRGFGRLLGQGRNHDVRLVSRECFYPPGVLQYTYIHIQCIWFLFINLQAANIKPNASCRPEHFFPKAAGEPGDTGPCLKHKKPDEGSGISSR